MSLPSKGESEFYMGAIVLFGATSFALDCKLLIVSQQLETLIVQHSEDSLQRKHMFQSEAVSRRAPF